jgi:hypothetical protein
VATATAATEAVRKDTVDVPTEAVAVEEDRNLTWDAAEGGKKRINVMTAHVYFQL